MKNYQKKLWTSALLLITILTGCVSAGKNQIEQTAERKTEFITAQTEETAHGQTTSGQTEEPAKITFKAGSMGDDYLLPDAAEHVYTEDELSHLTAEELRIARNELYARHGRRFNSEDLNTYFTDKSWYHGSVEPNAFDDSLLNQNERANIKVLKQLEVSMKVCTAPKIGIEEFPIIDGSTATLPLSQALYRFSTGASAQEAEKAVTHHKTTEAWLSLKSDYTAWNRSQSDLVIAYEPGGSVKEAFEESGEKLLIKPIGRDALVFLSNRSNPVKSLTKNQIIEIYSGAIRNWKDVGGEDQTIKAFQRPKDSGSQNLMDKLVMKGVPMAEAPTDWISGEMGELIEAVSAYDGSGDAIGYSVYYYTRNMYQKPELSYMAVDGVMPSSDSIRDGSYPYVNEFYAAIRADEPEDSKAYELFQWLTTEDGQSLINGLGYVGIGTGERKLLEELTTTEENFSASIGLPDGYVILASGKALYGEQGIGVFDSHMRLLYFINHVESELVAPFLECEKDSLVPMMDTTDGKYKYYSLSKKRWADKEFDDEELEKKYLLTNTFVEDHPELLKKYGVTKEAVDVYYYTDSWSPIIRIKNGNIIHYYEVYGNHLFDFDTEGKSEEELPYLYVKAINEHAAYMYQYDHNTEKELYLLYKDGVLVKELSPDERGEIGSIYSHFYTRYNGNYLYFYNEQDEPCAKFLTGRMGDD